MTKLSFNKEEEIGVGNKKITNQFKSGANILIADDNEDFLALLTRRVKKIGHHAVAVTDGSKAIEALKKEKFDLMIIDLKMPGISGLDVIEATKKYAPNLTIIIITGYGSIENAVEALRYRVFDYLTKPLESLKVFEITVYRALNQVNQEKENSRLLDEIQYMAEKDSLTGLYNRHRMNEELVKEVERAKRLNHPVSLMMIDLDDMKGINDSLGHVVGDEALRFVGHEIEANIRSIDTAFRYGGDEFLVILPGLDGQEAKEFAFRIFKKIRNLEIGKTNLLVSVGIAQWNENYQSVDDLVRAADKALYHSKNSVDQYVTVSE